MQNSNSKAGTNAQQGDEAKVTTSSPNNAKPNVVGSPLLRAWCKDFGELKMCHYEFNPCDNGLWFDMIEDFHSSEVLQVMKGIGCKDLNGKEIYEGDIVKWGHKKGGKEDPVRIAIVKMQPDIQFHIINYKTDFLGQNKVFHYGSFIYTDTEKWLGILGNVFENPELLEGVQ
jgi:uncharacterized phage protein (TIGR01671 family)